MCSATRAYTRVQIRHARPWASRGKLRLSEKTGGGGEICTSRGKRAAVQGFEFKLEGSVQSVIGRLPAAAFQEALGQM